MNDTIGRDSADGTDHCRLMRAGMEFIGVPRKAATTREGVWTAAAQGRSIRYATDRPPAIDVNAAQPATRVGELVVMRPATSEQLWGCSDMSERSDHVIPLVAKRVWVARLAGIVVSSHPHGSSGQGCRGVAA